METYIDLLYCDDCQKITKHRLMPQDTEPDRNDCIIEYGDCECLKCGNEGSYDKHQ